MTIIDNINPLDWWQPNNSWQNSNITYTIPIIPGDPEEIEIKDGARPTLKKKLTYVGICLDSSGSMENLKSEVVSGFNEQLKALSDKVTKNHRIKVALTTFATKVNSTKEPIDVKLYSKMGSKDYKLDGWTSLWDGIAQTIRELNRLPQPPNTDVGYLVIVISDGKENQSQLYRYSQQIKRLISRCQEKSWAFLFLGSNQDLSKIEDTIGIYASNVQNWDATTDGYKSLICAVNNATTSYMDTRAMGTASNKNLFDVDK